MARHRPVTPWLPGEHPPLDLSDVPNILRSRVAAEMVQMWPADILHSHGATTRWTYDLCQTTLLGKGIREPDEYPCVGLFPCSRYAWEPGMWEPLSATPIRALPRTHLASFKHREVCTFHWGMGYIYDENNLLRPMVCTAPARKRYQRDQVDRIDNAPISINLGAFIVLPEDNDYNLPGDSWYGIIALDEHPWSTAMYHGEFGRCVTKE